MEAKKDISHIIKILLVCLFSLNIYAMMNTQWIDNNLNDNEKEWIKQNHIITYSEVDWKPFSIIRDNKMVGILGDYLDLVSKKTGIKFKFIFSNSWPDVLDKFKKNEIDLIPGTSGVNSLGLLSSPFATYPMVAVTRDNSIGYIYDLESVKDKVFSVPKYWTSWKLIKEKIPNATIIETDSIEESILNVNQGKADIFIGHIAVSAYHISTVAPNLRISGKLDFTYAHHYLVHEKDKILLDIVNKVFASIGEKNKIKIYSDWAFSEVTQEIDYAFLTKIIFATIFVFLIIVFYSIKLNNVIRKTKKQRAILNGSIEYASTIQLALMANNHPFENFFENSFYIWEPKDIVGGDIYFSRKVSEDETLVYVIDCVGHGIPGALLTVYVKAVEQQVLPHFLNINEPLNTAKILDFFHTKMLGLYSKEKKQNQTLCFDGAVLLYNKKENTVKYSGANTPIFYIQNNNINIQKTNRRIIGISSTRDKDFIEYTLNIDTDTFLYIFTDGLIDQLGGEDGMPLGKSKLKDKLLEIYKSSPTIQKQEITNMLILYQGKYERIDDITFLGLEMKENRLQG